MKLLPTGLQVFETLRKEDLLYVDKTQSIYNMIKGPRRQFFLSRPRRFGKTLLCSALTALFQGRRELFEGLAIDKSGWQWESHPVIRLDMSQGDFHKGFAALDDAINTQLMLSAKTLGVELAGETLSTKFKNLIVEAANKYGKPAVVIVDEYDCPMLSMIADKQEFDKTREALRDFYRVIKGAEEHLRFAFLTGITKFAQVSVFSALNNLTDITLDPKYADLLGITQEELEGNFSGHIDEWADEHGGRESYIARLKNFYNGYRFSKNPLTVYNPFGLMQHFDSGDFLPYWFDSGSPSYLIKLLDEQKIDILNIRKSTLSISEFKNYDSDNMEAIPILYQSGYLTVADYSRDLDKFILDYPNAEVRSAFASELALKYLKAPYSIKSSFYSNAIEWLYTGDAESLMERGFIPFMAGIPYGIAIREERYFQTVFHIILTMFGLQCRSEVEIAAGRIDSLIETPKFVYCFEFKLNGTAEEALEQIDSREYLTPWTGAGKTLFKIGVSFDFEKRNIREWRVVKCSEK